MAAKPAAGKKIVTTVFTADVDCEHCVNKIMNNVPSLGKGIKDGTIDPVGLQKDVEPLMPDDLRAKGQAAMNQAQGPQAREVMQ